MYGLAQAYGLVASGLSRHALVIGADVLSKLMNFDDRSTCVLFGDGAGAVVIEQVDEAGLLAFELGADGSGGPDLHLPAGGSRMPTTAETVARGDHYVHMNGRQVFKFATRVLVSSATNVLAKCGLSIEDVDLYVPHQANVRIIDYAVAKLGIPEDRVVVNLDRYGNTSSASIPLALAEARRGRPRPRRRYRADDRDGSGADLGVDGDGMDGGEMSKIAFCFPGQGSLGQGMGREIAEAVPEAMAVFERGSEACGLDLRRLCFDTPLEEIVETEVQQPALVATSLAVLAALRARGIEPDYVIGHSVGEFAALAAADSLGVEETIALVRERGLAMAEAAKERPGSMAAILGLEDEVVEHLCRHDPRRVAGELQLSGTDRRLRRARGGRRRVVRRRRSRARAAPSS